MSQNTPAPESDPATPPQATAPVEPSGEALAALASPVPEHTAAAADAAGAESEVAAASNDSPPAADVPAEAAAVVAAEAAAADADADASAPKTAAIPDLSPAACAALLAERFPALFGVGHALPIKLRIQADIQARAPGVFNKKSLSIFLHRHTTSTAYIKALVNSPQRIDLDGQPAGEIAQEHKDAGVVELQRRQAIVQARRVAEREAQRAPRRGPAGAGGAAGVDAGTAAPAEGETGAPIAGAPLADGRPPRPPRGDRPPRGPRPEAGPGAPRADRPPRAGQGQAGERGPRPPRTEPDNRPPRPPRPDMQGRPDRGPRPPGPPAAARGPRPERPPRPEFSADRPFSERPSSEHQAAAAAPSVALTPEQAAENEARRSRAALLRAFESTTLTAANFCALKGLKVDALNAALEQARQERGPVSAAPAAAPRPNPGFAPRSGGRRP
jgi:ProP effector